MGTGSSAPLSSDSIPPPDHVAPLSLPPVEPAPEVLYGRLLGRRHRCLVTYRGTRVPTDVLEYIVAEEAFTCPEAELGRHGFVRCVDMPHLVDHVYYEGYMHAAGIAAGPLASMNPRTGEIEDKRPAPPRAAAFLEAFRRVNASWCSAIAAAVPTTGVCGPLVKRLFEDRMHFADLAVQVHFGQVVDAHDVGWHVDAPNSLLHMALSIHGNRALHSRLSSSFTSASPETDHVHWLPFGAAYISSPMGFVHGVEYPESTFADRTVAMQCRFQLREGDLEVLRSAAEEWGLLLDALTPILATATLSMPSLELVKEVEMEVLEARAAFAVAVPSPVPEAEAPL